MNAKKKLLSYIGALFMLAIFIVSTMGYLNFKAASIINSTKNLTKESFLISNALDQHIQRYFDGLSILGQNLELGTDRNGTEIVDKLKKVKEYFEVIAAVVALKDGTSYISSGRIIEKNKRALNREWYTRIFAGEKK